MKFTVKSIALSGVALGMFATVASAADLAPAASPTWTGFSIGIGGGGQFATANTEAAGAGGMSIYTSDYYGGYADYHDFDFNDGKNGAYAHADTYYSDVSFGTAAGTGNVSSLIASIVDGFSDGGLGGGENDAGKSGWMGTIRAGADYQMDQFVFGVDAAFNFGSTTMDTRSVGGGGGSYSGWYDGSFSGAGYGSSEVTSSLEIGNSWSIGGRVGFLAGERTLIFGSGGYQATKAELKARFKGTAGAGAEANESGYAVAWFDQSSSNDEWMNGFYVGAGVEQLLTDNISLKLEYRYSDLGSIKTSKSTHYADTSASDNQFTWDAAVAAKAEPIVNAVTATINYRF